MKIGITGHQERDGINWEWVSNAIRDQCDKLEQIDEALSSLAVGSDQVFAQVVTTLNIPLVAVIPIKNYESFFHGRGLERYLKYLGLARRKVELAATGDEEKSFLEAGRFVVDHCDRMFAVWDGKDAEGEGGTGDIVRYAMKQHSVVTHINPMACTITLLRP